MKFDKYDFGTFVWSIGCFIFTVIGNEYTFGSICLIAAAMWQLAGTVVSDLKGK